LVCCAYYAPCTLAPPDKPPEVSVTVIVACPLGVVPGFSVMGVADGVGECGGHVNELATVLPARSPIHKSTFRHAIACSSVLSWRVKRAGRPAEPAHTSL